MSLGLGLPEPHLTWARCASPMVRGKESLRQTPLSGNGALTKPEQDHSHANEWLFKTSPWFEWLSSVNSKRGREPNYGRQKKCSPTDARGLLSRIWEFVGFCGKRDFTQVIKVRARDGGEQPVSSRCDQSNHSFIQMWPISSEGP